MSAEEDLLHGAWLSAMRFVWRAGAIDASDLSSRIVGLRQEARVCRGETTINSTDWADLMDGLVTGRIQYDDVRALDGRTLSLPIIEKSELWELLFRGADGQPAFQRMRIFRGREARLSPEAAKGLCQLLLDNADRDSACLSNGGFCAALETAMAHSVTVRSEMTRRVSYALREGSRPQDLATVSYVLLHRQWTVR